MGHYYYGIWDVIFASFLWYHALRLHQEHAVAVLV